MCLSGRLEHIPPTSAAAIGSESARGGGGGTRSLELDWGPTRQVFEIPGNGELLFSDDALW